MTGGRDGLADTRGVAVRVLVAGGTVDKVHDPLAETLDFSPEGESAAPRILANARCAFAVVETVVLKDSLDFDASDLALIADAARNAPEDRLVITHGTGTMGATARYLDALRLDKTIVLTGALRPFSLSASDAEFNLGGAIVAAQLLGVGVWGVMNGRAIPAISLEKDLTTLRFAD